MIERFFFKDDETGDKICMENLDNHLRFVLEQRKDKLDYGKPILLGIVKLSEENSLLTQSDAQNSSHQRDGPHCIIEISKIKIRCRY